MIRSERGVSTVIDVGLALLLISASVVLIGLHLNDTDESVDVQGSERTAETLSGTSTTVEFDRSVVTSSENFEEPEGATAAMYRQTTYGSGTGMLADAAVANVRIGGEQVLGYAPDYEDSVEAALIGRMVGSNHQLYALARWAPYEGSRIVGNVTAGERPPRTEDVTSTTITVSSGLPAVDKEQLAEDVATAGTHEGAREEVGDAIARAVIEGYFPPEKSQYALERQGVSRSMKVYHYQQVRDALGDDFEDSRQLDTDTSGSVLDRKSANAVQANKYLIGGLSGEIQTDIRDGELGAEIESIREEHGASAEGRERLRELFEDSVSTSTVRITVQTWQA